MTQKRTYPVEDLDDEIDDGTMPENVKILADAVVGHKIISATKKQWTLVLTLDDGTKVEVINTSDCCAYTELENFFLDPAAVDHIITGVGTTDEYTTWHIYADWGDILKLQVGWSPGNPFYYGYGFEIRIKNRPEPSR